MNIKFRLYDQGPVKIQFVGYQRWNDKTGQWEYSNNNENWSTDYIKHKNKDIWLGVYDQGDVQLYENDIVSCMESDNEETYQNLYTIAYIEEMNCFMLINPGVDKQHGSAQPLYYTGADILSKVGCMHFDYKLFKEFGVGSKNLKK